MWVKCARAAGLLADALDYQMIAAQLQHPSVADCSMFAHDSATFFADLEWGVRTPGY
jgi:hypothetical protein